MVSSMTNSLDDRGQRFAELLGSEIRGEAGKRGIPAKRLAGLVNVHEVTMSKYLNARIIPPVSFVSDCADAIGVSADVLVGAAYARLLAEMGTYLHPNDVGLAASRHDLSRELPNQDEPA